VLYFNLSARGGHEIGQLKSVEYDLREHGVEHPREMDVGTIQEAAEEGHIGARNFLRKVSNRLRSTKSILSKPRAGFASELHR